MGKKTEDEDLITQSEAAELRGASVAAINDLVRRGKLRSEEKFGKRLVFRSDVLAYVPNKGGRPARAKAQAEEAVNKKGVSR